MNFRKSNCANSAAICLTQDDGIVVAVAYTDNICCMYFKSHDQLRTAIATGEISAKQWFIAVPREECVLKKLTLPATNIDEATKMVEFELPSLVPIPAENLVYSCTTVESKENSMDVFVYIFKKNIVDTYVNTCDHIGITLKKVLLDSLAIQKEFGVSSNKPHQSQINVLLSDSKNVLVASFDDIVRDIIFVPNEKDKQLAHLISLELEQQTKLLSGYSDQIPIILLSGDSNDTVAIKETILPTLGESIEVISPQVINYNDKIVLHSNKYRYESFVACGLLNLANDSDYSCFNLLPREFIRKTQRKTIYVNYAKTAVLGVIIILSMWLCLLTCNLRIERKIKNIKSQIRSIEKIAGSVDTKRQQLRAIQNQLSDRGLATNLIDELYKYTPRSISISTLSLTYTQDGPLLVINGKADVLSTAFGYTEFLEESDMLNTLHIENAQQSSKNNGGSEVDFRAECILNNGS